MTFYTSNSDVSGILPEDYSALVTLPVSQQSLAYQVSSVLTTSSHVMNIPVVTADATAAWTAEGGDISASDPTLAEVTATPKKVAGLTIVSRELANDSSPDAQAIVGESLSRALVKAVDAAFFGNTTSNGPSGLGSITPTAVTAEAATAGAYENFDLFAEAALNGEANGAPITAWVMNKATALHLATLKDEADSNRPLMQPDPTVPGRKTILGIPVLVSADVSATNGLVWGIPRSRVHVIQRQGAEIAVDRSVYFTSDRVAVRAIMRLDFAFTHEAAVQKITVTEAA